MNHQRIDVGDRRSGATICMPIFSAFAKNAFRTGIYEAQDILASTYDADFIELQPSSGFALKERLLMRLTYHDPTRMLMALNPGLKSIRLNRDYDVFVMVCSYWRDLWFANAIQGWRDRCKTSICWIDELWAKEVLEIEHWLHLLRKFDHVIFGVSGSAKAVSHAIGRPCHDVLGGVDCFRFTPVQAPLNRVIDVYSIGRRQPGIHRALLDLAARGDIFYVHDTFQTGNSPVPNFREHREMFANFAKRSRLFVVAPGKVDVSQQTGGQVDIGFRYFEGSAAGAILVGQKPDSEVFRQMFGWPDAVIELRSDGSNTAEIITDLLADSERLHRLSLRNSKEALLRHDWIYRWKEIFNIAGVPISPAASARENKLAELAKLVDEQLIAPGLAH